MRGPESMIRGTRRRLAVAVVAAVATVGVAAGCGGGDNNETTTSAALTATPNLNVSVNNKIAGQVPSAIKSKGTLTVAADATYAPNEFIASDGHTVIGMDADLAKALGQVLGLKVSMVNATFDTIDRKSVV